MSETPHRARRVHGVRRPAAGGGRTIWIALAILMGLSLVVALAAGAWWQAAPLPTTVLFQENNGAIGAVDVEVIVDEGMSVLAVATCTAIDKTRSDCRTELELSPGLHSLQVRAKIGDRWTPYSVKTTVTVLSRK